MANLRATARTASNLSALSQSQIAQRWRLDADTVRKIIREHHLLPVPGPWKRARYSMLDVWRIEGVPRAILEWWLKIARPVLMDRLQNPDPRLLLGGAGYARLNKAWRFATASVDFYMNLHQVRHAIASILWNEPGADINVIASLLGDHPETVARVYAFLDVAAQVQRAMDGMDNVNAALEKKVRL